MKALFRPSRLRGSADAPPSKSMAHRYLIGAALSGEKCTLTGVEMSEDVLASIDCLKALGANISVNNGTVNICPDGFMMAEKPVLDCRESGSTLRFFIPLALCLGREAVFTGSERLMLRPLDVFEELCRDNGFVFDKHGRTLRVCGSLDGGSYRVRGDISSQFITGLILALVYIGKESQINIIPPLESRPYVEMTVSALRAFGADVTYDGAYTVNVKPAKMHAYCGKIEGDYSNAAFLEAFNRIGSEIKIGNLSPESLQGDKIYTEYFDRICGGTPKLDISDCPDLGPVLFALAALKNGATFTGTERLKAKESDRGAAMHEELSKLGGGLVFGDNEITVPKQELRYNGQSLFGHNDHRIVMALSVILSAVGGTLEGAEAVNKSYPSFFEEIVRLNAKVELE